MDIDFTNLLNPAADMDNPYLEHSLEDLYTELESMTSTIESNSSITSELEVIYDLVSNVGISSSTVMSVESILPNTFPENYPPETFTNQNSQVNIDIALESIGSKLSNFASDRPALFAKIIAVIAAIIFAVIKFFSESTTTNKKTISKDKAKEIIKDYEDQLSTYENSLKDAKNTGRSPEEIDKITAAYTKSMGRYKTLLESSRKKYNTMLDTYLTDNVSGYSPKDLLLTSTAVINITSELTANVTDSLSLINQISDNRLTGTELKEQIKLVRENYSKVGNLLSTPYSLKVLTDELSKAGGVIPKDSIFNKVVADNSPKTVEWQTTEVDWPFWDWIAICNNKNGIFVKVESLYSAGLKAVNNGKQFDLDEFVKDTESMSTLNKLKSAKSSQSKDFNELERAVKQMSTREFSGTDGDVVVWPEHTYDGPRWVHHEKYKAKDFPNKLTSDTKGPIGTPLKTIRSIMFVLKDVVKVQSRFNDMNVDYDALLVLKNKAKDLMAKAEKELAKDK